MDSVQRPPAFVASVIFGVVGLALFVAGIVTGADGAWFAGIAAGALSLGAALYWRSQLVEAWHSKDRPTP
jgi:hypothetical protein